MAERDQPPDGSRSTLDNVLEKIRQQLKLLKGGLVLILAAAVVVVVVWTAWFTVQPEETGIVQRFGKVMRTAGPGLHFKLPYGIETVRLLPTARVLKEEFGFRTVSVTRGKDMLVLAGTKKALGIAVRNHTVPKRYSHLKELLSGEKAPIRRQQQLSIGL